VSQGRDLQDVDRARSPPRGRWHAGNPPRALLNAPAPARKKLDRGTFALPEAPADGAAHVEVDEATFEALRDGLAIAPTAPAAHPPRRLH
jgi:hypothetical protein